MQTMVLGQFKGYLFLLFFVSLLALNMQILVIVWIMHWQIQCFYMMIIIVIVTSLLCYEDREVCVWWC